MTADTGDTAVVARGPEGRRRVGMEGGMPGPVWGQSGCQGNFLEEAALLAAVKEKEHIDLATP